jgi:glyoxylase-like metal-dependent hydrolase (beta-lactamase superfamily II)
MKTTRAPLAVVSLVSLLAACGGEQPAALAPAPAVQPVAAPPAVAPPPVAVAPAPPVAAPLKVQVVTGSPEGFLVTSTLVTGQKDALLIDAQFTLGDGKKVAEAIKASGKTLTTVYVTHSHPDHYFGFSAIKEAFPSAKLVALPATVEEIRATWEGKVKQWKPMYKDAITDKPVLPEPLAGTSLELEGQKLEIVGGVQGDEGQNSYVWIPSLRTAVVGDIAYDEVFPWTAETSVEQRKAWIASLDKVGALNPAVVVPGHQKAEQKQDPSTLKFTKDYLLAYDEALSTAKKPAELQAKLKAKYPNAALDIILKIGAEASFKKPAKTAAPAPAPKKENAPTAGSTPAPTAAKAPAATAAKAPAPTAANTTAPAK